MKKLLALVLALVMVMSLATTAFAASGTNDNSGSITIDKAHEGFTYSIYQILVLESYNTDINSYIYKPVAAWEDWINDADGGGKYLVLNDNGTVKWNGTATQTSAAAFVAEALAYAKANNIEPDASKKKDTADTVVKFEDLNLGYYLVDSSAGALCSLDTVYSDTTIEEKNLIPLVDKKVLDQEGNWQESISESVTKEVTFASKVTVYAGTHNFVYHDKMDTTLDYVEGSVKVYWTPMANDNLVAATNYAVVETGLTDDCTFEVRFTDAFMATITQATDLTIVYKAVLTEEALIAEPNTNYGKITYGEEGMSEWDPAEVYTYKFGIVKTDISNHILEGAEFDLYLSATGDDMIPLVKDTPNQIQIEEDVNYYRPATPAEQAAEGFVSAKIEAGKACIWGIRGGIALYLEETKAPVGYNQLSERHHITALTGNNLPEFDADGMYLRGGVEVENLAGAQLPQTGGIGTTLFYVFGALMVAAAVVLLVTKKRMNAAN